MSAARAAAQQIVDGLADNALGTVQAVPVEAIHAPIEGPKRVIRGAALKTAPTNAL